MKLYKEISVIFKDDFLLSNLSLIEIDLNNIDKEKDYVFLDLLFNECDLNTLIEKHARLKDKIKNYNLVIYILEYLYFSCLILEEFKDPFILNNEEVMSLEERYRILEHLNEYNEYIENYYPSITSISSKLYIQELNNLKHML